MRKKGLRGLFLAGVVAAMFSGCGETSVVTISDAQEAKEALNTASSVCFKGDLEAVNQKTDILADGAIAGRMEESGFINTKWTVTVGGETWFYMKIVTDEPVNEDTDDYIAAATYGYYDENDKCLGYAQKRAIKGDESHAYYFYFMDAEQNLKDYRMEENGEYFTDMDGNMLAEADSGEDVVGNGCQIQIDMEEGCDIQIDFMDKMEMYIQQYDELRFWHSS